MDPNKLPITTRPINTNADSLHVFNKLISIEDKDCLCIGFDGNQISEMVLKYKPSEIKIMTLWKDHKDANINNHTVEIGDISKYNLSLKDNEFDFVLTLSLLEHITDLEAAFKEIRRILKPDGYFVVFFGPVWSCHFGHHIYSEPGNPLYDFCQWQMPSHLHLLCSEEEIRQYYTNKGASKEQCDSVIEWFFKTKTINRLFFEDYFNLFTKYFYVTSALPMFCKIDTEVLKLLHEKYPNYNDFVTYGGSYLLRNRK